jgi:hypothetical protein
MTLQVPEIESEELLEAVSALTRAADTYRKVLFIVASGNNKIIRKLIKHKDLLTQCDKVINTFRHHLGHDEENANEPDLGPLA